MNVDPSGSAAMQLVLPGKCHYLGVRHRLGLCEPRVKIEQFQPATPIANQQFAEYQVVPNHFIVRQQAVQRRDEWHSIGKPTNPDRGIYEDHYATRRFRAGLSRRRGTSCASGSVPSRARARW